MTDTQNRISARFAFDSQRGELNERYGEPESDDGERLLARLYEAGYDDLWAADIDQIAGWDLGNGQEIILIRAGGDCIRCKLTDLTRYIPAETPAVKENTPPDTEPEGDVIQIVFSMHMD